MTYRFGELGVVGAQAAHWVVGTIEIQAPRRRNHEPIGTHALRVGSITTRRVSCSTNPMSSQSFSSSAGRVKNFRPVHMKVPSERASVAW